MLPNGSRAGVVRTAVLVLGLTLLILAVSSLRRRQAASAAGPAGSAVQATPTDSISTTDAPSPTAPPADPPPGFGLTARNLLLIVNQNEPAGRRLAEFYAAQRHVPPGRILALNLPAADELTFDDYNAKVVSAVRAYLADNKLADEVSCLVTFYGVPLRVGPRTNTPAESAEYRDVTAEVHRAIDAARQAVGAAEDVAKQADPAFRPSAAPDGVRGLLARHEAAVDAALPALAAEKDEERKASRFARLTAATETLLGPLETVRRLDLPAYRAAAGRGATPDRIKQAGAGRDSVVEQLKTLSAASASDPAARAKVRDVVAANLGAVGSIELLAEQKIRLETSETEAAVDSELACLWWPDDRLRFRWADNPLYFRTRLAGAVPSAGGTTADAVATSAAGVAAAIRPSPSRTLMVTRIDAPSERLAHDLIATSVRVEAAGLRGNVALDARGKAAADPYGRFDETLRTLADELSSSPPTKVTLDDREPVFPPGAVRDAALYCGWYSLRHYVPGVAFAPGAVGYHVASLELVSLHNPAERGWVRGLMADGVVATVGAVAEPYLHSFPLPTEFFPLLATGKLTLAEVYWSTTPLVSWMTTCVGDPLYRPYAVDPLLHHDRIPVRLHAIFDSHPDDR